MYIPHCLRCDTKFKLDVNNKDRVWYFGKLEYHAHFCADCRIFFVPCNGCGVVSYNASMEYCGNCNPETIKEV